MATKPKNSTTPGRERRSSTSPASLTKRPTKPTTPDKSSLTSNSSSTAKPVPNYLRSTASSSRQTPSLTKSRSLKKHHVSDNQDSNSPKPTLNRGRSFDKPPSPSGPRKIISPGRESRDPALRSKSFSVKSISNAPKPTSKSVSGTKPQASFAKSSGISLRRSTSGITSGSSNKESRSSRSTTGSSRAPRSHDITQILNLEANLEALDHHEVGEVDKIESIEEDNSQDLPDPKLAEEDLDDQQQQHASDTDQANGHDTTSVKDAAEESKANVDVNNEEVTQAEKNIDGHHDQVEEVNHISKDHESNDIDHHPEEGSGLTSEETIAEEVIKEKKEDENKNEVDMEVVDGGSNELDPKEGQDGDIKEEAKPEEPEVTETPQAAAATTRNNKKEAAPAYNDVIEETASKLMAQEKRRNKVKALVGAFETVIDHESGSKLN
ncbi:putative Calmodulin-binding domain, plant [Rosa chinensis]|uniref:Putative Calmodulin-binding domain, plant n=1 Tax=Rosa chinensis TaxID=74649 RepID=A0A2P6PZP0_ROSCH|nr:high mobility group nucleosome-binding domain-containing protein 5 [Rosa chinensis]XP_024162190.1 high mobility group nucleosome-binding domain-containing protein 5 [Rosa chinensis]PRQ27407.1 putative Calmodulin-binding domain, plant [Rosa chinensis]